MGKNNRIIDSIGNCKLVAVNFALHDLDKDILSAETSTTLFLDEEDAIQYLRESFENEVRGDEEGKHENEASISDDGTSAKIINYRRDGSVDVSEWWVTTALYQHPEVPTIRISVPGGTLIAKEKSMTGTDEDNSYPGIGISQNACTRSVKDICRDTGLSQRKLAERFHIPYRTMENWCSGKRKCPEYTKLMMQQILGLYNSQQ